jgi:hypothetical protein
MDFDFEAGERAAADLPDPTACLPPGSMQPEAPTFPASTLPGDRTRREPAQNLGDVLARFYEPCPQGDDCAGDGKHRRLFDCSEGCGFRGCAACMEVHESEAHASDTATMLERFRDVQS